jgi:NitT/TauT family transport system permease protein
MVAEKAWEWLSSGLLFMHVKITFIEMILGALIGTTAAIFTGFLLSASLIMAEALMPFISALYGIPRIALAPLFIMWFGIDVESKIALVSVVVFFLVFFNAFVGAREVDKAHMDSARIMGASQWQIFRLVVLPHSAGWIFVGLKFALPRALIAAVVAEIVSSNRGLGYLLENSGANFDVSGIFVAVLVMALVGVAINALVNRMELWTSRYRFLDD